MGAGDIGKVAHDLGQGFRTFRQGRLSRWRRTPGFTWADRPSTSPSRPASTSCRRWCAAAATRGCPCACWAAARTSWCATKACRAWSCSLSAPAFTEITVGKQTVSAGGGAKLGHAISTRCARDWPGSKRCRHSRHDRRRAARQRRQPRRRYRPVDLPGHGHDPRRRDRRAHARGAGVCLSRKLARRAGRFCRRSSSWKTTIPKS